MGASFPLPDSNTLSIEGIPLVTEETYLLVTPDSGTSALSNNPGFTLQQQGMENNVVFITTQEAIANLTHGAQLGRTTKGRSRQWVQQGGLDAAIGAFHALGLANITQRSGGVITGETLDGGILNLRAGSTYGSATIEVQSSNSKQKTKVRYE